MKKLGFVLALVVASSLVGPSAKAAFVLSVDPADLTFAGPGTHEVDVLIRWDGVGNAGVSGYTIRFGNPANASLGEDPTGVSFDTATERTMISSNLLFNLNPATNSVAATSFVGDTAIPTTAQPLFSLGLTLGNAASYAIGVDFQNAQRGGLFAQDISSEFFNPNNPQTDFTFTLTQAVAVPEPSSMLALVGMMGCGAFRAYRRRNSTVVEELAA